MATRFVKVLTGFLLTLSRIFLDFRMADRILFGWHLD